MADKDFTADARCALQMAVDDAFLTSPNQTAANRAAVTAQALTAEQTGRVPQDTVSPGALCTGAEVIFLKTGDTIAYSGAISGDSVSCDLGDCVQGEALKMELKPVNWIRACVSVNTDTCASVTDYAIRRSHQLNIAISQIRVAFAKKAIAFLDAHKQHNKYGGVTAIDLGNGAWKVATSSDIIAVPAADLTNVKGLGAAERVVVGNEIGDHFWVHGSAWYDDNYLTSFADQNIGCCDYTTYRMFATGTHYWDLALMDTVITPENGNSFAINPGSYMFVPFTRARSLAPELVGDGMYRFHINDPNWFWSNGGVRRPIPYNVLMTRKCTGRNAVGDPIFVETYEVTLLYALEAAPASTDGITGILNFAEASTVTTA